MKRYIVYNASSTPFNSQVHYQVLKPTDPAWLLACEKPIVIDTRTETAYAGNDAKAELLRLFPPKRFAAEETNE